MGIEAFIVLAVLALAFALLLSDLVPPDIVAVLVLVALVLTGVVAPAEAFVGFSSFAVLTIAGLMIIGEGLQRTGVVQWVARRLERVIRRRRTRLVLVNTAVPGLLSGFVNIVAAASFFVPVILRLCKQMRVPQSKILLPMATAALIGANLSLIGASHNLVVHSMLEAETGRGFGFFEFAPLGAVLLVAALAYVLVLGPRLLPGERTAPEPTEVPVTADLAEVYALADRMFETYVSDLPNDLTVTVEDLGLSARGLTLLNVVRDADRRRLPAPGLRLQEGDVLLVQGRGEVVERFCEEYDRLTFIGPPKAQKKYALSTAELAEAVVPPRSPFIGRRLGDLEFTGPAEMAPIACWRGDGPVRTGIQELELRAGDSVLFYGPRNRMREFDLHKDMLIYFKPGRPEVTTRMKRRGPVAAAILLVAVAAAALNLFPIAVTAVAGAAAMVLLGIVEPRRTYRAIDWRTLVLIGGMYPLGVALATSGAADALGSALVAGLGGLGPVAVLAGVSVVTMVLTQPIHNAAVAIIMTPVALDAAARLDSDPHGFCAAVVVACSASFLMPYGHPAPYLVKEPGGYRAGDYVRYGLGLNLLALAVIVGVVPLLWPL